MLCGLKLGSEKAYILASENEDVSFEGLQFKS